MPIFHWTIIVGGVSCYHMIWFCWTTVIQELWVISTKSVNHPPCNCLCFRNPASIWDINFYSGRFLNHQHPSTQKRAIAELLGQMWNQKLTPKPSWKQKLIDSQFMGCFPKLEVPHKPGNQLNRKTVGLEQSTVQTDSIGDPLVESIQQIPNFKKKLEFLKNLKIIFSFYKWNSKSPKKILR